MTKYLFALLLAASVGAADVKLAWDPSPTPGVTNYVLYASTNILSATNLQSASVRLNVGTNLTATVEHMQQGRWSFAATAWKDRLESDPSNIVIVEMPEAPGQMRTVVSPASGVFTNFFNLEFLRIRLP